MEKGEIVHFEQFHLFPQSCPKVFLFNVLKEVYMEEMVKIATLIIIFAPHERRHYIFIRKGPMEAAILIAGFRSCSSQNQFIPGLVRPTCLYTTSFTITIKDQNRKQMDSVNWTYTILIFSITRCKMIYFRNN